jgi:hypothetical protein
MTRDCLDPSRREASPLLPLRSATAVRFVDSFRGAGIARDAASAMGSPSTSVAPEATATSGDVDFSIPIAARPRAVMRSANAPWSSSRRQTGNVPPAPTSSTKPSLRSLVSTLLATTRFGFPVSSTTPSSRCAATDSSTSCVSVSFFGVMLGSPIGRRRRLAPSPPKPRTGDGAGGAGSQEGPRPSGMPQQ